SASAVISLGDATKVLGGTFPLGLLTLNDAGAATITSQIAGGADTSLVKNSAGTLTINGNVSNTYTGETTVNTGTVQLNKSSGNAIGGNLILGDRLGGNDADQVVLQ